MARIKQNICGCMQNQVPLNPQPIPEPIRVYQETTPVRVAPVVVQEPIIPEIVEVEPVLIGTETIIRNYYEFNGYEYMCEKFIDRSGEVVYQNCYQLIEEVFEEDEEEESEPQIEGEFFEDVAPPCGCCCCCHNCGRR
ncbi:MAG: hypothetical protein ATN36_03420 [Epulopiscium sp. Nele67-Bin005]|nr:MAG: hypothetical protein ATN36_03420 [Epulopiscium sp. Nele67-Bin005]